MEIQQKVDGAGARFAKKYSVSIWGRPLAIVRMEMNHVVYLQFHKIAYLVLAVAAPALARLARQSKYLKQGGSFYPCVVEEFSCANRDWYTLQMTCAGGVLWKMSMAHSLVLVQFPLWARLIWAFQ